MVVFVNGGIAKRWHCNRWYEIGGIENAGIAIGGMRMVVFVNGGICKSGMRMVVLQ